MRVVLDTTTTHRAASDARIRAHSRINIADELRRYQEHLSHVLAKGVKGARVALLTGRGKIRPRSLCTGYSPTAWQAAAITLSAMK